MRIYFNQSISILSILTFLSFPSLSQTLFLKGYLIINNDTLRGYIDEKIPKSTEVKCKTAQDADTKSYPLSTISGFGFTDTNEEYVFKNVDIDKKPIAIAALENTIAKRIVNEPVFLKYLVKGKVDLLTYRDENNKVHFFYQKNGETKELNFVRYLAKDSKYTDFEEYKQQLKNLTVDCPKMETQRPSLSEQSLIHYFQQYNNCLTGVTYQKKASKSSFGIFITAGFASNNFSYAGADSYHGPTTPNASSYPYSSISSPMFGLALLSTPFARGQSPFSFGVELIWKKGGAFISDNGQAISLNTTREEYTVNLPNFITTNVSIKYSPLKQAKIKPYLKAGLGLSLIPSPSSRLYKANSITSHIADPLVDLRSYGSNVFGAVGVSLNKFYMEARFDHSSFSGAGVASTQTVDAGSMLVGYRVFGK
jgi:hypothetical protein